MMMGTIEKESLQKEKRLQRGLRSGEYQRISQPRRKTQTKDRSGDQKFEGQGGCYWGGAHLGQKH